MWLTSSGGGGEDSLIRSLADDGLDFHEVTFTKNDKESTNVFKCTIIN